jgi:ABC-type branched-subunit amino acid transport system ATPase component
VRETGVTIVMVEHVMEVVMPLVDRAVVLHLGKVLAEGLPKEVVRDEKVIAAYLGIVIVLLDVANLTTAYRGLIAISDISINVDPVRSSPSRAPMGQASPRY